MLNDGFGVLTDDVEEMIESREALLRVAAGAATKSLPHMYDDMLQEARIEFWKVFSKLEGEALEFRTAVSIKAAKQRILKVINPNRGERMTGHLSGTGTSEVKAITSLDRPIGEDTGSLTLADTLLGGVDALAGVELAYHHGEILQALNMLPEHHREYVYMRFWEGRTDTEIAALKGLTSSKVLEKRWSRTIRPKLVESLAHLADVVRT